MDGAADVIIDSRFRRQGSLGII